jgi:anaerobic magnesium-protoporphyrin IX monomethyl ester cyclase
MARQPAAQTIVSSVVRGRMKILLVCHIDSRPSMAVMCLSAALRREGHAAAVAHLRLPDVARALERERFDVIAVSYPTCFAASAAALCRRLRESFSGPILAGGPHPTYRPESVLAESAIDAVCLGEGEQSLVEGLAAIASGRSLGEVPGWWARRDGTIVRAPLRRLWPALDELPFPDRDILLPHVTFGERVQPFLFTRGCTFGCTYCFEPVFRQLFHGQGPAVRRRSVESAVEELLQVKRAHEVRLNVIYDDTFNLDRAWLHAFCSLYARKVGVPFSCKVRADLLDEDGVRALASAGCVLVFLGVESGDDAIRRQLLGRSVSDRSLLQASEWIHRHGMKLVTYNLAAIPGTRWSDDLRTLDLNLACRPEMTMVMYLQPYAGTPIHETAVRLKLWGPADDERLERSGLESYRHSPLRFSRERDRRRVENLRSLFGITLALPALRRWIPLLVELPLDRLYARLCSLWYLRGHLRVLYPRMASPYRLLRAALRQRFSALRPFSGLSGPSAAGRDRNDIASSDGS